MDMISRPTVHSRQVVEVHYWPSRSSVVKDEGVISSEFGHVALETFAAGDPNLPGYKEGGGHYISFWPGICAKANAHRLNRGYCELTTPHFHSKDQDGYTYPRVKPETTSLNLNAGVIHEVFRTYIACPYDWALFVSPVFRKDSYQNCASLSLRLLESGGLNTREFEDPPVGRRIFEYFAITTSFVAFSHSGDSLKYLLMKKPFSLRAKLFLAPILGTAALALYLISSCDVKTPNDVVHTFKRQQTWVLAGPKRILSKKGFWEVVEMMSVVYTALFIYKISKVSRQEVQSLLMQLASYLRK